MKRILFILTLLVTSLTTFSQSQAYYNAKSQLIANGYTIADEKYASIVQGAYLYSYRTFYQNVDYIIVATSDDADVTDLDIYFYYLDGDLRCKDNDASNIAVMNFSPGATIELKIVVYNFSSRTPNYASTCRYIVAFK